MKPTPNQLALLISLIGAGIAHPARAMSATSLLVDEFGPVASADIADAVATAAATTSGTDTQADARAQALATTGQGAPAVAPVAPVADTYAVGRAIPLDLDPDAGPIVLTILPAAPAPDTDAVMRSLAAVLMAEPPAARAKATFAGRPEALHPRTIAITAPKAPAASTAADQPPAAPVHTARVKLAPRNVLEPAARGVVDEYSDVLDLLQAVLAPDWSGPVYADVSVVTDPAPATASGGPVAAAPAVDVPATRRTRVQLMPSEPTSDGGADTHAQVLQLLAAVLSPGWSGPSHAAAAPMADVSHAAEAVLAPTPPALAVATSAAAPDPSGPADAANTTAASMTPATQATSPAPLAPSAAVAATAATDPGSTPAPTPPRVTTLEVDLSLQPALDLAGEPPANLAAFGLGEFELAPAGLRAPDVAPEVPPDQAKPRMAMLDVDIDLGSRVDTMVDIDLGQPVLTAHALSLPVERAASSPHHGSASAALAAGPAPRRVDLAAETVTATQPPELSSVTRPLLAFQSGDGRASGSDQILSLLEDVLSPAWAGPSHTARPAPLPRDTSPARNPFGEARMAVAETELGGVRGGFSTPDGLQVSFGIERAVYINGNLVTSTSLNLSELGKIAGGAAGPTTLPSGAMTVVQNGAGNTFQTGPISAGALGTVIQNTLNGQKIESVTVINATVNSLGIARSMNNAAALRGAMIDSLRR